MLNTFLRAFSFSLLSLALISSIFFRGELIANALSPEANGDNPLNIVIDQSDNIQKSNDQVTDPLKYSERPDLGDDQVFPFVAGLDSYEK